jgi:RNA polymerase sigma factor (sigma-70 family)
MEAASELIARHQRDLLRVAHALLGDGQAAQDAAQEAFMAMCRDRERLAANASKHRSVGGWLCTVVRNHCLDQLRARAYRWPPPKAPTGCGPRYAPCRRWNAPQ